MARINSSEMRKQLAVLMDTIEGDILRQLEEGLHAMVTGDLTRSASIDVKPITDVSSDPEQQPLVDLFNKMLARGDAAIRSYEEMRVKLSAMIQDIQDTARTVAAASNEMASTSEETGRAVSEIARAIEDVAHGAEQTARSVSETKQLAEEVADASQTSAQNAQAARDQAQDGAAAVSQASQAMETVRTGSEEVADVIRSLGDKSDHIGGIIVTITGIAQQTNLLALNAAIEAARAGEQGRGFAVVAEEVRKLAEESQRAAASIGDLIGEIQNETSRAVTVVEASTRGTAQGVETVEQARQSFEQISESVSDMSGRVIEIAASAQSMQRSMTDVAELAEQSSAATEEISASTEQTSASAQEIAASAQELAATAETLQRLVSQFSI